MLARVRLLAMDVDGVLTDGRIIYSSSGDELREFHAADGLGIVLLRLLGIEVAWITGRESAIVARRASELKIKFLRQGVQDKGVALTELARSLNLTTAEIAYIGDDWNDLPAYLCAGVKLSVANGHTDVRAIADAVTERTGGSGAVREIVDALIDAKGCRELAHTRYFDSLRKSSTSIGTGQ
jgi:3-deoxy-D-manno-octulosonate 8-phosphate phosphatase (KDO 8-P phosphatase)